jgi:C-terminal processing protease CtpA/Prc
MFIVFLVVLIVAGCVSGYQQFYEPYDDARTLSDVELLKPDEEPKVYGTNDFDRDIRALRSKQYVRVGYSSFNGQYEDESNVKAQAKRIGATIILVNAKYTDTQTTTSLLFLPNSSTTYGNTIVPITTEQRRYDQTAVFFVKSTKKLKFGVILNNLSDEQRRAFERNTGAIINVVVEGSPAFNSNVLPGDILIKVNDSNVRDAKHASELMQEVSSSANSTVFTVIRNGKEQAITIKFGKT